MNQREHEQRIAQMLIGNSDAAKPLFEQSPFQKPIMNNKQKAEEYAAKIMSDYQLSSPDLHTALTEAVLYGVKLEQGNAVWVNEDEIPLDIEQAAEKWADSQYPFDIESAEWIAARNGYRQCWRDLQAAQAAQKE